MLAACAGYRGSPRGLAKPGRAARPAAAFKQLYRPLATDGRCLPACPVRASNEAVVWKTRASRVGYTGDTGQCNCCSGESEQRSRVEIVISDSRYGVVTSVTKAEQRPHNRSQAAGENCSLTVRVSLTETLHFPASTF